MRYLIPVVFFAAPLAAQSSASRFELTIPSIMRGPEIVGRQPSDVRWSPDGQYLYFQWLPPGSPWRETLKPYRVRAVAGARPEALTRTQADSLAPSIADGALSPDRTRRVVSVRGDLYLVELPSGRVRRLTDTPGVMEVSPSFDQTGGLVFFRRDNNVMAFSLADFQVRQLTDIRPGPAPDTARRREAQRTFLEAEERSLIGAVRDRLWRDSVDRAAREARDSSVRKTLWLEPREEVLSLSPSPNGRAVMVVTRSRPERLRVAQVPSYVTTSGYTEQLESRTFVGDLQERRRLGVLEVSTGRVSWVRPIATDSTGEYSLLFISGWNDAGTTALVFAVPRNRETRHVVAVDGQTARLTSLDVLRDSAWVNGPCFGCAGWLPGDAGVWFVSEADGWAHLYVMGPRGEGKKQLTSGRWEVLDARLSPDRTAFVLHTSEPSLFERHVYTLPVSGGTPARITDAVGGHEGVVSPDGRGLADVYSTANRPPELFLQPMRRGAAASQFTTSPTAEWLSHGWLKPEIVRIPASDGVEVPARVYRPEQVGASPNGAAVIFVHGAGYLHNVHQYWSTYYREYMFHHFLAARGYVVLDLDYRGSAGYGRDWRTAIYRYMGGRDLLDQVDGSRWLRRTLGISPDRVGIYGGSYGGFITLMALFTQPKDFGAGAALRSVTDWAHYNHGYTGNILNEPQQDSVAYRRSSPIYFAEGLEDPLLIAHGMVDVNVHFQDVVRLSQRLIELGKTGWELAVYPVEDHGFVRPDSWTDEYRRIFELFERALRTGELRTSSPSR
ncbi:MAG: prolyl oligopeptidase family serine peptidase [Gemmatimonadales bacterium]